MKNQYELKKEPISKQKRSKKRVVAIVLSCVFIMPIAICALSIGVFALWAQTVPLDKSLLPTQIATPTFFDANGDAIDYCDDTYIAPSQVPTALKDAFVALEDKRFYTHKGYDVVRILGATLNNAKSRSIKEGASTITQQLVKNTHLTNKRTLSRKLKEIAIATKLEKEYSKDEILSMYLSVIYFGNGAYGAKSAAKLYFSKDISELNLGECATLAGIVKNPKKYSPFFNENECIARRNLVLLVMKKEGYINENEYSKWANSKLDKANDNTVGKKNSDDLRLDLYLKRAQEEVCSALHITKYQLENSGYKIYTNLDIAIQKQAARLAFDKMQYQESNTNGAIIVCDNKQGEIKAYVSTLPYETYRQPGSVLKPIAVYAPAIDMDLVSLATPICDEKIDFSGYSPSNFGGKYYGETNIRQAIKKSMNTVAVKVMSYLGVDNSISYLSNFGISTCLDDKNYALSLGALTNGTNIVDIANAYACLSNLGEYQSCSFIKYAVHNGKKVFISSPGKKRVIKQSSADIINDALLDTVKDGTAVALSSLQFEICAKTGTAQRNDTKNSDAWCASYNDDYTLIVWHGSDDGMSEKGGGHCAKQAANLWRFINDNYTLSKCISKSNESVRFDVDTYATQKNKTIMHASENTPIEYRKSEIFHNYQTFETSTIFDSILVDDINFDVTKNNGGISIAIDNIQDIYGYKVYRNDIFGDSLICEFDGEKYKDKKYGFLDTPLALFGFATYRLECFVKANESAKAVVAKRVYFDEVDYNFR